MALPRRSDTPRARLAWLAVAALVMLRRNPQYLKPAQMEALKVSIRRDGFCAPILVRPLGRGRYEVVSGNHRLMAATELGHKAVPCVVLKLKRRDAQRLAVNLNTIHGDPNAELLAPFLAEMDESVLREIYVAPDVRKELLAFDAHLAEMLEKAQPPDAMGRDSSRSRLPQPCTCPTCGRKHARSEEAP